MDTRHTMDTSQTNPAKPESSQADDLRSFPVLWTPSNEAMETSNIRTFEHWLEQKRALRFGSYLQLWSWSVNQPGDFWEALWEYFDVNSERPYDRVMSDDPMPGTRWFEGATLNLAEHVFRNRTEERPALYYASEQDESGVFHSMSWQELEEKVVAVQQFMRNHGIQKGDRVVGYLPNRPETTIIWLATIGLGAVWSCCSPDFGVKTVLERFSQIQPDLFFAAPESVYAGKRHSRRKEIEDIRLALPGLKASVLVTMDEFDGHSQDLKQSHDNGQRHDNSRSHPKERIQDLDTSSTLGQDDQARDFGHQPDTQKWASWVSWNDVICPKYVVDDASIKPPSLIFEQVEASHPLWVLYSSGTTGKPKAIIHSHAGILMEHMKYLHLQNDVKTGEVFFWYTTTGWMMWNFLQGSMLVGAIPFLYDGSPAWPDMNRLWAYAESLPIHHFGTSAPWLAASAKLGHRPVEQYDLTALRSVGSTGAPLSEESFDWVYTSVGEHVWLCSMSGGTDVCTAFVGGCILEPVRRELIQQRALGCNLIAMNEQGISVFGELGELAILTPMPSMPVGFWGDSEGRKYHESYFSNHPGIWIHGDWIRLFKNGSLIIQGRSDATLNRGGVRIGTAEIYSITESMNEVSDSLILFLEDPEDRASGELLLFVVAAKEADWHLLPDQIRSELRKQGSPRHVPDRIIPVEEIPYTLSGKKMEVPMKRILRGEKPENVLNPDAVRNPEAIDFFVRYFHHHIHKTT